MSDQSVSSPERPSFLYHYTSMASFLSILRSNSLWATDSGFLNDSGEGRLLSAELQAKIQQLGVENVALDWDAVHYSAFCFVTCFCDNSDLLSQWQSYGQGGVAIGFYSAGLEKLAADSGRSLASLVRVQYVHVGNEVALAQSYVEENRAALMAGPSATQKGTLSRLVRRAMMTFKSDVFEAESEWRIVVSTTGKPSDRFTQLFPLETTAARNLIIPHVSLRWRSRENEPRLPIGRIVVGPRPSPRLTMDGVKAALLQFGYNTNAIEISSSRATYLPP